MSICSMNCGSCEFKDCINDSDVLTLQERKLSSQIDKDTLSSRNYTYTPLSYNEHGEVDKTLHKQAQSRYFRKKYRSANLEYYREKGRENYRKRREKHLAYSCKYNQEHKEEISANKRAYYLEHREEILAKRKESYVPSPRVLIDTPEAEAKRQRERERYQKNKEEINRRRRERRKLKSGSNKNK